MIRLFRPTPPERSWMRTGCGAAADRAGPPIPDAVENTPGGAGIPAYVLVARCFALRGSAKPEPLRVVVDWWVHAVTS